jgi:cation diffusion facilitator CzcD-associated flavoprotein CzcO
MASHPEGIDHAGLRVKYRQERDKRIRPEGRDQYVQPIGRFAYLLEDPYVRRSERAPVREAATVVIVGGGFGGLVTGARLKQAGVHDVRILEGAGDVGGAWYWNRYPGAMCDTAAMIYLPLLEETRHVPSRKYTFATEIFEHAQRIARHFGLYDKALFSTRVTGLEWDGASSRWLVYSDRGDEISARFVAIGAGPLHRPKLPGVPGLEAFRGRSFHTSRWDYSYTGGDPSGAPMANLRDKQVGIIGTGATAVQCVPRLARDAKDLFVFQRTPSSIDLRNNQPIDPAWFSTLKPGWQEDWLTNFATLQTGGFAEHDLVQDGWTDIARRFRDRVTTALAAADGEYGPDDLRRAFLECDDEKMEELRARVDAIVKDPATAARLKPWYRQLCKRPCFHDEYLQAFNESSCHLVDTDGRGVERIDATGVWAAGRHYPLDCLIFASGFEVGTPHARRSGFEVKGRSGKTLSEHWADGMQTLHGIHVHGFPNAFVIGGVQGGNLISNVTHNLVESGTTIAAVVAHALATRAVEVEATREAEAAWVAGLEGGLLSFLGNPECTPGYYNNEGHPIGARERLNQASYSGGPVAFFRFLDDWRRSGAFEGLEFRGSEP